MTTSSDPEHLVMVFSKIATEILDKHAPLKKRSITVRPLSPWYNDSIKCHRREMKKAEKRWRRTQLVVHKEIYRHLKNALTKEIMFSKKRFMQDKIASTNHS